MEQKILHNVVKVTVYMVCSYVPPCSFYTLCPSLGGVRFTRWCLADTKCEICNMYPYVK